MSLVTPRTLAFYRDHPGVAAAGFWAFVFLASVGGASVTVGGFAVAEQAWLRRQRRRAAA